jgi:hypothetical protein
MQNKIGHKLAAPDGTRPASAATERIKTVIVEDDAETRATLTEIVEDSAGYDCLGAYASGAEAVPEILRLNLTSSSWTSACPAFPALSARGGSNASSRN